MEHRYEDLSWRTLFVCVAVSVSAALGVATSGLGIAFEETNQDATMAILFLLAAILSMAAFVIAIVAVCLWTYRATANSHSLALADNWVPPSTSPAYAVGCYFIPFVNLAQPYRAMREIDSASLGTTSTDPVLGIWWGTWILGNILANVGFRFDSQPVALASDVLHVLSAVTLVFIVRRIHANQRAKDADIRRRAAPVVASFRDAPVHAAS